MSIGLVALLDDIAALAKAAAASVDDVAGAATKASSKAIGGGYRRHRRDSPIRAGPQT